MPACHGAAQLIWGAWSGMTTPSKAVPLQDAQHAQDVHVAFVNERLPVTRAPCREHCAGARRPACPGGCSAPPHRRCRPRSSPPACRRRTPAHCAGWASGPAASGRAAADRPAAAGRERVGSGGSSGCAARVTPASSATGITRSRNSSKRCQSCSERRRRATVPGGSVAVIDHVPDHAVRHRRIERALHAHRLRATPRKRALDPPRHAGNREVVAQDGDAGLADVADDGFDVLQWGAAWARPAARRANAPDRSFRWPRVAVRRR